MSKTIMDKKYLKYLISGYKLTKKAGFKLSGGDTSLHYFDLKSAMGNQEILYQTCIQVVKEIESMQSKYNHTLSVGGIETGSIGIASAVSLYYSIITNQNMSFFYVRKSPKLYGTLKMIEGKILSPCVLIDDVMMKGTNVKDALNIIKANSQKVSNVIPIVFRGTEEEKRNFEIKYKVGVNPIFMESDFDES